MSYQELNKTIDALRVKVEELKGTKLHSFFSAKIVKLENATDQIFGEEMYMEKEEMIINPYPDFPTFKAAIMPRIIRIVANYLDGYLGKTIRQRGNISYTDALLQFFGIANIDNWKTSFRSNTTIDAYLQTIFDSYGSQLTDMSIDKYATAAAKNIWIDFVEGGASAAQTTITEADLGAHNPYGYNLADELAKLNRAPRRFRRAVNNYQETMLNSEPEGFEEFSKQWRRIIQHIDSYENSTDPNANMSRRQIRRNIRSMLGVVNQLIQENKYFTYDDYGQSEVIVDIANPQSGIPSGLANNTNSQGNNTSNTTNWIFDPEYIKITINIPTEIRRFNGLGLPFVPAPPFPTGMPTAALNQWLIDNNILDGEIPEGSIATVTEELRTIALYLNRDRDRTITITGRSNYGTVSGNNNVALQVGLARANKIRDILVSELSIWANQITTMSVVGSPIGIVISQP
jgi:hypothetical protein